MKLKQLSKGNLKQLFTFKKKKVSIQLLSLSSWEPIENKRLKETQRSRKRWLALKQRFQIIICTTRVDWPSKSAEPNPLLFMHAWTLWWKRKQTPAYGKIQSQSWPFGLSFSPADGEAGRHLCLLHNATFNFHVFKSFTELLLQKQRKLIILLSDIATNCKEGYM